MSLVYAFTTQFSEHIVEDNIGQLICKDVILARDGIYDYTRDDVFGDGSYEIVKLHRDWEEVRKLKYTLEGKPIIHNHTAKTIDLSLDNISDYRVGHVQNIRESTHERYNVLIGDFFINKKEIIPKIKDRSLREVSLGYFYDIDESNPNKIRQINMIAEHVALVKRGRAGISKILDSDNEGILVRSNKDFLAPLVFATEDEVRDVERYLEAGWIELKDYGFYKFWKHALYDQGSSISNTLAKAIIRNEVDLGQNSSVYDFIEPSTGDIINSYNGEKELGPRSKNISDLELVDFDEVRDEVEDRSAADVQMVRDLVRLKNKWLSRARLTEYAGVVSRYNLPEWKSFRRAMLSNCVRIKELIHEDITKDDYDLGGELLHVLDKLERVVKYRKKIGDQLSLLLGVVTYSAEGSNIDIVTTIDEVNSVLRREKKKVIKYEELDEWLKSMNKLDGVYIFEITDLEESRMFVSKVINEEDVEVMIFEDIDTLNKYMSEFFNSFDEAYLTINRREGRHKKLSAAYI